MEEKETVQNVAEQQVESRPAGGIFKNITGDLRVFLIALFTSIIVVIAYHLVPVKWFKGNCDQDSMCLVRVEEHFEKDCPKAKNEKSEKIEKRGPRRPRRDKKFCPECKKRNQLKQRAPKAKAEAVETDDADDAEE